MEPYKYAPLRTDVIQIRLFTLLPGNFSDELQIVFHEAQWSHQLDTSPELPQENADRAYTALSYVWGSEENPSYVVVQEQSAGGIISVTQNLDIALRHLRNRDQERVLWVDAICINQRDLAERSSQVPLMTRIYSVARQVVVWLGPEQDDGEYALSLLDSWGSKVKIDWTTMAMTSTDVMGDEKNWVDSRVQKFLDQREAWALFHFMNRQWFERLWVQQEVLTSAPKTIKCGNAEFSSQSLTNAIFLLNRRPVWFDLPANETIQLLDRKKLVYDLVVSFATTRTLERLRFDLRGLRWGNPVDAIYASLSLLTPHEKTLGIVPDYTLPPAMVFQDVATKLIEGSKTLSFLASCELTSKSIPELPTWVPDWSSQINTSYIYPYWSASAWISPHVSLESDNILRAAGIRKATVRDVHDLKVTYENGALRFGKVAGIIRSLLPADLSRPYVGGGDMCEAYTRTFSTDYFSDRFMEPRAIATLEESKTFICQLKDLPDVSEIAKLFDAYREGRIGTYLTAATALFSGRCFFTTSEGYIGLAPRGAQPGDSVCVVLGCRHPMLLRSIESTSSQQWQIVGACFVPGLMSGEAIYGGLSEHLSPVQYVLQRNLYKLALRDKHSGVLESDSNLILERFGIPVAKVEYDPYVVEVTPEALRGRGINVETLSII